MLRVPHSYVDLEKTGIKRKIHEHKESLMMDDNESLQKCVSEDKPDEEDVCPICLEGSVSLEHRIIYFQFERILIKLCLLAWYTHALLLLFPTVVCLIGQFTLVRT